MQETIRVEILKLLDNRIIYPISDSQWVSPVHAVPKKAGFTVVKNEKKELTQACLPTMIRVCIDYRKLNFSTCKDHFPLPFINQMLERLARHEHYCFLNGYFGYNQVPIAVEDQEKTMHLSILNVYIPQNSMWIMQRPNNVSTLHAKSVLGQGRTFSENILRRFLSLLRLF